MAVSNNNERMFDTQNATRRAIVCTHRGNRSGRHRGRNGDVGAKASVSGEARAKLGDIETHRVSHGTPITTAAARFYTQALPGIQTERNCRNDGDIRQKSGTKGQALNVAWEICNGYPRSNPPDGVRLSGNI